MRRHAWMVALAATLACCQPDNQPDDQPAGNSRAPQPAAAPQPDEVAPQPDAVAPQPDADVELLVRLRVHLLHADELELLDATMTRPEVDALIAGVNEIWAPAHVRFELERVVDEQALAVAEYAALVAEQRAGSSGKPAKGTPARKQLRAHKRTLRDATLPLDQRIEHGVDIYVHRALISAGGVFSCHTRAVVFGEYRGARKREKNSPAILAHELGHALGLHHVPCADDANLMMTACAKRTEAGVNLRPEQISAAREIAATGEARVCAAEEEEEE